MGEEGAELAQMCLDYGIKIVNGTLTMTQMPAMPDIKTVSEAMTEETNKWKTTDDARMAGQLLSWLDVTADANSLMAVLDSHSNTPLSSWVKSQSDLMLMLNDYQQGRLTKKDIQSYLSQRATGRGNTYDDYADLRERYGLGTFATNEGALTKLQELYEKQDKTHADYYDIAQLRQMEGGQELWDAIGRGNATVDDFNKVYFGMERMRLGEQYGNEDWFQSFDELFQTYTTGTT